MNSQISPNFAFLQPSQPQLVRLATLAERYFSDDPSTALVKIRQFGELLAQTVAAHAGLLASPDEAQNDLLRRLRFEARLPAQVLDLFHHIRKTGNIASHTFAGDHTQALTVIKLARALAVWFHQSYGRKPDFKPGPFIPPEDPARASVELHAELDRLRAELTATQSKADQAAEAQQHEARARETAEQQAARHAEERALWESMALEAENEKAAVLAELQTVQAKSAREPVADRQQKFTTAEAAATHLSLDEADTRMLIDQQLRNRKWDADSKGLTYKKGTRPSPGANKAIAEWPTSSGPADYALFAGTKLVGFAEAKRKRKNVSAAIDQAERYAKSVAFNEGAAPSGGPWGDYKVPFVFSSNGRAYLKQVETETGIWFRDTRSPTNLRHALPDWYTPEGLIDELGLDRAAADKELAQKPFEFGFPLRPYQIAAIQALEAGLSAGKREMLAAMATGTGKTKLAIALLYRLLEAKRFRRICFVVDRSALGTQTHDEFTTTKVVSGKDFASIFGLKGLEDVVPDRETQVHICTIQGLVKRVLFQDDPALVPSVDQYDLLLIDECHRGYLLDRELSDADLEFRDQEDYVSKYRRVLEHFDAVKIGLTATPALHTKQIFGNPVFTYSYREAVVDGYLIDHEPPHQILTKLSKSGITFDKGDELPLFNTATGEIQIAEAPDELSFDVSGFNRKVITEPFNRALSNFLVTEIDISLPGKTLIFAATDGHADIIVKCLKDAYVAQGVPVDDSAIKKITGSVDNVRTLIKQFRNDAYPQIAVTVDLLTTGVDIPSIVNLVFVRRVNSRILYEQMLGRATRLCPDLFGASKPKEVFRIFDAVGIYETLEPVTGMKPVVVNPTITFEKLFEQLAAVTKPEHAATLRDELAVKLRRRLPKLSRAARMRFEAAAGATPEDTLETLLKADPGALPGWANGKGPLGRILDWSPDTGGTILPVSGHEDEVISVTRGYGEGVERPEDFLDSFGAFVRDNVNKIAALNVVVTRPKDLTRQDLRSLALELAKHNFSEANLRQAWRQTKNEDIAASIIGFVRQAALKEPLVPYSDRVRRAMAAILASKPWTNPQRQWLTRIGEQLAQELVVDRAAFDDTPFQQHGGFKRLNAQFNGELEGILSRINEELWKQAS